jgi:hypothetical protein
MEDFNFKYYGVFDTSKILKKVTSLSENDWKEYTFRQEIFYDVHGDTITIPILYEETYRDSVVGKRSKFYDLFEDDIVELNTHFKKITGKDGIIIRAEIVKMIPNSEIAPHRDMTPSLILHNRVHIPIQTNENVLFNVDGEEKNLKINEIWEINNSKLHSVTNNSNLDRIHLIVDWKKAANKLL